MFLMKIEAKIPSKLYQIVQSNVKIVTQNDHTGFILEIQVWFNTQNTINVIHNINNSKKKNQMITSNDV